MRRGWWASASPTDARRNAGRWAPTPYAANCGPQGRGARDPYEISAPAFAEKPEIPARLRETSAANQLRSMDALLTMTSPAMLELRDPESQRSRAVTLTAAEGLYANDEMDVRRVFLASVALDVWA